MKIQFVPSNDTAKLIIPPPKPAKEYMPDWFSKMPIFHGSAVPTDPDFKGLSAKGCMSFMDTFTTGYIQETWCDIYIDAPNRRMKTSREPEILSVRDTPPTIRDDAFDPMEFVWRMPWFPVTPKGWSVLFTHPMNRLDLPFFSTAGIIDSDVFHHVMWGNFPFYVKKDFKGVIPEGTPMYQMIPFKRDDWESELVDWTHEERIKRGTESRRKLWGVYKKYYHQKKRYS